jgi:copper chaperone CopZ
VSHHPTDIDPTEEPRMSDTYAATYVVTGMTCAHCVASVTEEVQEVPGVEQVEVSLEDGTLRLWSSRPVDEGAVRAAVEEAGYALTPAAT